MKTMMIIGLLAFGMKISTMAINETTHPALHKLSDTTTQVTDPVCGMKVNPKSKLTLTAQHEKNTYYFCSAGCRKKFVADPKKYLKKLKN